jgi:tRNA A37 threonylcarbamoyladenosine dehydratase
METGGDRKPGRDEPRVSRVSTEKITVTRSDGVTNENVRRHDHPSEQQVGRIIIDEFQDDSEIIAESKKVSIVDKYALENNYFVYF